MSENRCVCCGEIIPEGRQVCPKCVEKHKTKGLKLELCPFCGGKANLDDSWPHHVYCTQCGARVTSVGYAEDGDVEAIRKWNNRV